MESVLSQVIFDTLVTSGIYLLAAISFALAYCVARFFHFSHGALIVSGPYLALLCCKWIGFSLTLSCCVAVVLSACLGGGLYMCVYRPLRHRKSSTLVLMLASLGLYVVIQHAISLVFGDYAQTLTASVTTVGVHVLGARVPVVRLLIVVVAVVVALGTGLLLTMSRAGKSVRAVGSAPELAAISGVDCESVVLATFGVGSALGATVGILLALDIDMTPTMGLRPLIMGITTMVIAGGLRLPGLVLAAILLAALQHSGALLVGSQWQDAIAFVMLLAFLLFRPWGLLGVPARKAAV